MKNPNADKGWRGGGSVDVDNIKILFFYDKVCQRALKLEISINQLGSTPNHCLNSGPKPIYSFCISGLGKSTIVKHYSGGPAPVLLIIYNYSNSTPKHY